MHQEILRKIPTADLRVYAVWLPVLGGDERDAWDDLFHDRRVINVWDPARRVSHFLGEPAGEGDTSRRGLLWDAYVLFDREAQWTESPGSPLGQGSTVYSTRQQLRGQLARLYPTLSPP